MSESIPYIIEIFKVFAQKEDYALRFPLDKVYIDKPLDVFTVE